MRLILSRWKNGHFPLFEWSDPSIFGANATAASVNLAPKLFLDRFPPSNAQNSFYAVSALLRPASVRYGLWSQTIFARQNLRGRVNYPLSFGGDQRVWPTNSSASNKSFQYWISGEFWQETAIFQFSKEIHSGSALSNKQDVFWIWHLIGLNLFSGSDKLSPQEFFENSIQTL